MTDLSTLKLPPLPAMPLPDGTLYGADRKPRGPSFLPAKLHAHATLYGQLCLDIAQATSDRRIAGLRAGNTALLEALMLLVGGGQEAHDRAMDTLRHAGVADSDGALDWPALAARKEPTQASLQPLLERAEAAEHDFVEGYHLDDGEHAPHYPTEFESLLIVDAIAGLLADEAWQEAYHSWDMARRAPRARPETPHG